MVDAPIDVDECIPLSIQHMKTRAILGGIMFVLSGVLLAQGRTGGTVSGVVRADSTNRPLEFVNVVLLNQIDSAIVTGTITDAKGRFQVNNVQTGGYFLRFSLLGFRKKRSSSFTIDSNHNGFDAGTIFLKELTLKLGEVTVTEDKPIFSNSIDRKVYNVQQDILSKTGSISDLLQNVPSVQVDVDGTVSLRGSSNVQILINGKVSPLLGISSGDALQQMPASSVEKIEVITNPSAKFTPEGTSGIINIVMKKDANLGSNGNATANFGNSWRYNFSANGNYSSENANIFGNYSIRKDERNSLNTITSVQRDSSNSPSYSSAGGHAFSRPLSHFATLGIDFHLNEMDKAGLSGSYRYRSYTSNDITTETFADSTTSVVSDYDRHRIDYDHTVVPGLAGFFEHEFEGQDHKLRVEFTGSHMFDQEDNRFNNVYRVPAGVVGYDNTLIQEHETKGEFTIEYHHKLNEHSTLDAGYVGRFDREDFNFQVSTFDPGRQLFTEDIGKTNQFLYREAIHALYATYENSFGLLSMLAGLRAEKAFITSDLLTTAQVVPNDYFRLYPTLHLAYKINEFDELQLNYSLRVNRPEGDDLNPFPEYRDPRNVQAGNPYLKPEFIHSIEFGYQWQKDNISILPSVFYRNRNNKFTSLTEALNDSTLLRTKANLSSDQSGGLEVVFTGNLWTMIAVNMSTNAYYEEIDASNLGFGDRKSTVTWSGSLNLNVNLSKGTMVQINSTYRSLQLTPQGEIKPAVVVNLGARQDLLDGKLSLTATVSDILRTFKRQMDLTSPRLMQNSLNSRDSRVVFFGLTYHFGRPPKQSGDKKLQYDEED